MKKPKFPEFVFVSEHEDRGGLKWLSASAEADSQIDNDGPTFVATYRRVEVKQLSKRIVSQDA